jgi:hypothetical protein
MTSKYMVKETTSAKRIRRFIQYTNVADFFYPHHGFNIYTVSRAYDFSEFPGYVITLHYLIYLLNKAPKA